MVQIHGPDDEPLRVQVHATRGVYIVWNEDNTEDASSLNYSLGERLRVTVAVLGGVIDCKIENLDKDVEPFTKTYAAVDKTGYFKVGCYTQSSIFLSEFKSGATNEPLDAYGEMSVTHIGLIETY